MDLCPNGWKLTQENGGNNCRTRDKLAKKGNVKASMEELHEYIVAEMDEELEQRIVA